MRTSMSSLNSWKVLYAAALSLVFTGCGTTGKQLLSPPAGGVVDYQGTASVGDFLSITIDHDARTLTYDNHSNGTSGAATYTVAADGSYSIEDPSGNFVTGFELPGFALVLQAQKSGPDGATPSLVLAILKEPFHKSDAANANYNYMQFRTNSGGMELGAALLDGAGNVRNEGYWPYGGASNQESFMSGGFSTDLLQEDPSGNYLYMYSPGDLDTTYIFRTVGGVLAVDGDNGSHICMLQQPSKNFSPSWAGSYGAILYMKENAHTAEGNVETGDISFHRGSIDISAGGVVTVRDQLGAELVNTALVPVADDTTLVGPGKLQNDCPGLFAFSIDRAGSRQNVYVAFLNNALLLSSFAYDPNTITSGGSYSYFYGVGLRK